MKCLLCKGEMEKATVFYTVDRSGYFFYQGNPGLCRLSMRRKILWGKRSRCNPEHD